MLAQAVTDRPGHVNNMPVGVPAADSLNPGDALMTSDPWLGAGHVFDFVDVTPAVLCGKIVGRGRLGL